MWLCLDDESTKSVCPLSPHWPKSEHVVSPLPSPCVTPEVTAVVKSRDTEAIDRWQVSEQLSPPKEVLKSKLTNEEARRKSSGRCF